MTEAHTPSSSSALYVLPLRQCSDNAIAGGKAINLGELLRAGFDVPDGFAVTTTAYSEGARHGFSLPDDVKAQVLKAYQALNAPLVAVRSSATAEDMAGASMAGQYETFLNIANESDLIEAIEKCWASVDTPRTRAYLSEHNIDIADVGMAVVVQVLCPSDKAGVLFTQNPQNHNADELLIEASYGLGESVVSGTVQPDTLSVNKKTGALVSITIGSKAHQLLPGQLGDTNVSDIDAKKGCLTPKDIKQLWEMAHAIETHFPHAQDVEWGIHDGKLMVLQSRAITTLDTPDASHWLREEHATLTAQAEAGHGPWVRHNISETLPHPTPLTWDVIKRFMSGAGGYGNLYRRIGFEPSDTVTQEGFLTCIAGKIYMDLSRSADMFFADYPFRYELELLKVNPDACQGPPTIPDGSAQEQLAINKRLVEVNRVLADLAKDTDTRFDNTVTPTFNDWLKKQSALPYDTMELQQLLDTFNEQEAKVLDEFAPESLLPSMICAMATEHLRQAIKDHAWHVDADQTVSDLMVSERHDMTLAANEALKSVAQGNNTVEAWLTTYGHRAPAEFDLATPRFDERPGDVIALANQLKDGDSPAQRHQQRWLAAQDTLATLLKPLTHKEATAISTQVDLLQRYLPYRENAKYHLMRGYAMMRKTLLAMGNKLDIGEKIFFLTRDELVQACETGMTSLMQAEQRQVKHHALKNVPTGQVIETDTVESFGVPQLDDSDAYDVFNISPGEAQGPVKIVQSPEMAGDIGSGYILVCNSTDPSWTPLFVNAAGLVMECGGSLSHGAVVAREMGIPAVVLPQATTRLTQDAEIKLNAQRGKLWTDLSTANTQGTGNNVDENDTAIDPLLMPPPVGAKERTSAMYRNVGLLVWGVFLALCYLVFEPTQLEHKVFDLFDIFLLPLIGSLGKPATVAIVALLVAFGSLWLQRKLTDNDRLLEAKRRAAALTKEANTLPKDSPRQKALLAAAAPVQTRVTLAAIVPLAVCLGPMMLSFMWFPTRVDSASRNAKPGTPVTITAISYETDKPLTLVLPDGFELDDATPATQRTKPYTRALKRYHETLVSNPPRAPRVMQASHWAESMAIQQSYATHTQQLDQFLKSGQLPPQKIAWRVYPPKDTVGRWDVAIKEGETVGLQVPVVLGDGAKPVIKEIVEEQGRRGKTKMKLVQVTQPETNDTSFTAAHTTYQESLSKGAGIFWKPLAWFEAPMDRAPTMFEMLLAPWLVLYLLVYIPAMFMSKAVLRVA